MVNHSKKYMCILLFLAALLATVACEEEPIQITVPAFDRPKDVALVCYDTNDRITLPISCCQQNGVPADADCGMGLPFADLFAFVTQTTMGEVAVVNMADLTVIDQEISIPYATFIPVGGQPSDIVALADGSKVITANYETRDLSIIQVIQDEMSVFDNPSIQTTLAVDLGGAPARMGIVKRPAAFSDRFILVTQPNLGRVAVVALDEDVCGSGSLGCMIGYISLRDEPEEETDTDNEDMDAGVNDEDGGVGSSSNTSPRAIEMSENTPSAFIGMLGAPLGREIVEIDAEVLINEALESYDSSGSSPVELSDNAVVQYIDTNGKDVKELSLEPVVEKWMYGIDYAEGDVFVINLRENQLEILENGKTSIEVSGQAIALKLFRDNEGGVPAPRTFDGTFAVVSTTFASIYVLDVDDENADAQYPHQHSVRSFADFNEYPPELNERPDVIFNQDFVVDDESANFVYFENDNSQDTDTDTDTDTETETETGTDTEDTAPDLPDCDDILDHAVVFKPDFDFGFRFRCDNRQSSSEDWTLTWEGTVGIEGAAVIVGTNADGQVHLRDESTDFCNRGLKVDIRVPGAGSDEPGGGSAYYENYLGDVLVITSEPTPANENSVCTEFEDPQNSPMMYKIEKVLGTNELLINNSIPFYGEAVSTHPMPTEECFGQAFSYEIRTYRHWTIIGSSTGRLRDTGVFNEATQNCIPDPGWDTLRTQRIIPNVQFANPYFTFKLLHGENYSSEYGGFVNTDDEDTGEGEADDYELPEKAYLQFKTKYGYIPMGSLVGNNVTDIEMTPDKYFLFVDQAQLGLVMFNITSNPFGVMGRPVN